MKKAKLAVMGVTLSYIFSGSVVYAAELTPTVAPNSVAQSASVSNEPESNFDQQGDEDPIAKWTQLAIGGATDAAPTWSQHSGESKEGPAGGHPGFPAMMGGPPGMCKPGPAMAGRNSMFGHHFRCPWEKLEGTYALTDEQYQKLYDIKGQFIASIVPKGLNVWMLGRKMKDLLNVGSVDANAVKDVEKQIAAATSDLSMTAMDSIIAANQVLTPEQRKELHRMDIRSTLGGGEHHHHHHHDKESHSDK